MKKLQKLKEVKSSITYRCFSKLLTWLLLSPFPGLEDISHFGEFAFAFGRRSSPARVSLVLSCCVVVLQVDLIICMNITDDRYYIVCIIVSLATLLPSYSSLQLKSVMPKTTLNGQNQSIKLQLHVSVKK